MDKFTFGNKLYKLRTESNLTQKDLANILGVSDKAVSKWETGEAMPRVKTLKNIADCFSVTYEDLLSQTEELKTNESEKYEAYESFYQKRVRKLKKDINDHLIVVLFAAVLNLIIKAVVFVQAEFAGVSITFTSLLLGDFVPLVFIVLFFITLKKYLKTDKVFGYKEYSYTYNFLEIAIDIQLISFFINFSNIYVFLCNAVISAVLCFLGFRITQKYKKGKDVKIPKREVVLYTGILLLVIIAAQLVNAESVFSALNIIEIMFVNFLSFFIMFEVVEYQSLLEVKKETEEKTENKVKRNVKKVIAVCLVVVLTLSVLALFVPGLIFKTLAQRSSVANPNAVFYDELAITFEEENLTEYSLEGIKISLPYEYELLEKNENEYSTGLKFSKKGCDDFQFSVLQRTNFETEPLDIPGSLFSGENGEDIKRMFLNTFGYVPSTNQEYYRLLYSINPDDANIFDFEECITYFVMVKLREIYTWGGSYEFEFYDNGVFLAEIIKSKGVSFSEKGEMEVDESGKFEMYAAVINFYADEQGADYYQIFYRPESSDTADLKLLHKVLNTVEKVE
jgi:transcriptional regulator with XRE-family HTH domain